MKYCFGVDIGGTTVKLGLFSEAGAIVEKWEIVTRKENNGEMILPDIAKAALGKPFPQEEELRKKSARLAELNAELNIDDKTPMERLAGDDDAVAKSARPSILQKLRSALPEQPNLKPKQKEMEAAL